MTREELHSLVWSEPVRIAAKAMGISDVALAKQCRARNVPIPPRGWWARRAAGKPVKIEPLPQQPFALRNYFPALDRTAMNDPREASQDNPPPPRFRDLAAVTSEIETAVGAVRVPMALTAPHRAVARLLEMDAKRERDPPGTHFFVSNGPRFQTTMQRRRLRLLSSVLLKLEELGCKVSGNTHAGERFGVDVGGHHTNIILGIEGSEGSTGFYYSQGHRSVFGEGLRFDLTNSPDGRSEPLRTWRDAKDAPLERQATQIVCGLLLAVEESARKSAIWYHRYDIEQRARAAEEARLAAMRAQAERVARAKAAAAARLKALSAGAEALERAQQIRRYVAAVQQANASRAEPVAPGDLDAWAAWALAEADGIDPVVSGAFLANLEVGSGE